MQRVQNGLFALHIASLCAACTNEGLAGTDDSIEQVGEMEGVL